MEDQYRSFLFRYGRFLGTPLLVIGVLLVFGILVSAGAAISVLVYAGLESLLRWLVDRVMDQPGILVLFGIGLVVILVLARKRSRKPAQ